MSPSVRPFFPFFPFLLRCGWKGCALFYTVVHLCLYPLLLPNYATPSRSLHQSSSMMCFSKIVLTLVSPAPLAQFSSVSNISCLYRYYLALRVSEPILKYVVRYQYIRHGASIRAMYAIDGAIPYYPFGFLFRNPNGDCPEFRICVWPPSRPLGGSNVRYFHRFSSKSSDFVSAPPISSISVGPFSQVFRETKRAFL